MSVKQAKHGIPIQINSLRITRDPAELKKALIPIGETWMGCHGKK